MTTTANKLTKIGARRLLKLAGILDKADALHKKRGEPTYSQESYRHACGTPACAWGHWAHATPRLGGRQRYAFLDTGAEGDFRISINEADELFGPLGCGDARTAAEAAKYIRAFVKRKGVA